MSQTEHYGQHLISDCFYHSVNNNEPVEVN